MNEPSFTINYSDLIIQLENGSFLTKTYEKPINLYQYLTPNSAHPQWMIRDVVAMRLFLSTFALKRLLKNSNAVLQTIENKRLGQKQNT
jgi:hypothetical protein